MSDSPSQIWSRSAPKTKLSQSKDLSLAPGRGAEPGHVGTLTKRRRSFVYKRIIFKSEIGKTKAEKSEIKKSEMEKIENPGIEDRKMGNGKIENRKIENRRSKNREKSRIGKQTCTSQKSKVE